MRPENILVAESLAHEFIRRVNEWDAMIKRCHAGKYADDWRSIEKAAVRRASMDLTRALAKMRRP